MEESASFHPDCSLWPAGPRDRNLVTAARCVKSWMEGESFFFFFPSASCRTNKPAFGDAKAGVNEAVLLSHGEVWWQSERQKKNTNGQQHSSVSISKQLFNNNLTGRRQRSSTNFYQVFLSVIHAGNYIIIQSFYPDTGVLI